MDFSWCHCHQKGLAQASQAPLARLSLIPTYSNMLSLGWLGHCIYSHCVKLPGHFPWELRKQTLCCLSCSLMISVTTDFGLSWFSSVFQEHVLDEAFLADHRCNLHEDPNTIEHQTPCGPKWSLSRPPVHTKLRQLQTLTTPEVKEEATSPGEPPASSSPQPHAA